MSKQGLWNLSFLDLSDNAISEVASDTFVNVTSLRTLRLRDNRLSTGAALAPLYQLEELDFSGNALVGPLEPKSLPAFPRLRTLILDRNQLSSVRLGALTGLPSLQSLSLRDNQIDVLEDHAFKVKRQFNSMIFTRCPPNAIFLLILLHQVPSILDSMRRRLIWRVSFPL